LGGFESRRGLQRFNIVYETYTTGMYWSDAYDFTVGSS
jgi:hypothetical protein